MHGDRTQNQRNQALAGFRDGRYRVLVATDVAARGIHVDSVAHVVNYDLPRAPMDFIHRIGRTGRAGQGGTASTFSLRSERGEIRRIERECRVRLIQQSVAAEIVSEASTRVLETAAASPSPNGMAFTSASRLRKTGSGQVRGAFLPGASASSATRSENQRDVKLASGRRRLSIRIEILIKSTQSGKTGQIQVISRPLDTRSSTHA